MPGPNQSMDEGDESDGAEFDDAEGDIDEKQVGLGDDAVDEDDMAVAKELSRRDLFNYYSVWKNRQDMVRYVPSASKGSTKTKPGEIPAWGPKRASCASNPPIFALEKKIPLRRSFVSARSATCSCFGPQVEALGICEGTSRSAMQT